MKAADENAHHDLSNYCDTYGGNGVGIEHLQQLHIGGNKGDKIALVPALKLCGAKSSQRFEHLVPDYCKEREGYVMIGFLLGISQHCTEKGKYRQQYPDSFQRQWSIIAQTVQHGISAENRYELHRQKAKCACDHSQHHKSCQRFYKPQHSEKCTCFAALFHAITSFP